MWVQVLCVYFEGWSETTERERWRKGRERQRGKEKRRREITFLKGSETICCTENMFAAGERYIC